MTRDYLRDPRNKRVLPDRLRERLAPNLALRVESNARLPLHV